MKNKLRDIIRKTYHWPYIGRFIHICGAIFYLPEFRSAYWASNHHQHIFETEKLPSILQTLSDINHRQHILETEKLPSILQTLSEINHKQHIFETEQLPSILQTLSDINHRQLANDSDQENLVKSVPVALRKITRDILELRTALKEKTTAIDCELNETREKTGYLNNQINDLTNSCDDTSQTLQKITQQHIPELRAELEEKTTAINRELNETREKTGDLHNQINDLTNSCDDTSQTLQKITQWIEAFKSEQLPYVLNMLSHTEQLENELAGLKKASENIAASTEYLLGRVEFVRRELMYELQYGGSDLAGHNESLEAKKEILSPAKLSKAKKNKVRLNLGCGHIPKEGYLNIDRRLLPGIDIIAEVNDLPFEPGEVDEIFSAHLLEHFPQEQLCRELLPYFYELLKSGGEFRAIVPDAEAMMKKYFKGTYPYDDLREVMFGGQEYGGNFHFNMFTPDSLGNLLAEAGFNDIKLIETSRKNGRCFEFEISALK